MVFIDYLFGHLLTIRNVFQKLLFVWMDIYHLGYVVRFKEVNRVHTLLRLDDARKVYKARRAFEVLELEFVLWDVASCLSVLGNAGSDVDVHILVVSFVFEEVVQSVRNIVRYSQNHLVLFVEYFRHIEIV